MHQHTAVQLIPHQFPELLKKYGLSEELLYTVFQQSQNPDATYLSWNLCKPPTLNFYIELHGYLQKCPMTKNENKTAVGKFYNAIDPSLRSKMLRPDNAFAFIENKVKKADLPMSLMSYGRFCDFPLPDSLARNVAARQSDQKDTICNLEQELLSTRDAPQVVSNTPPNSLACNVAARQSDQKDTICHLKQELLSAREALQDVSNKCKRTEKELSKTKQTLKVVESEAIAAMQEIDELEKKIGLSRDAIMTVQKELSNFKGKSVVFTTSTGKDQIVNFCCETKSGKHYSAAIRKLYYRLLVDQISPSKISQTIKAVLSYLVPEADLSELQLPGERCAGYMRADELEVVSMAHKATHLSKLAQTSTLSLNSDDTTLNQKKLGAIVLSGTILSVNDLPDGCAETIIEDMDAEFSKLRNTAHKLNLANADSINWTLVSSSTADSASTQKKLNSLIEKLKDRCSKRRLLAPN